MSLDVSNNLKNIIILKPVSDGGDNDGTSVNEYDTDGDGIIDKTVTQTFDENGNMISEKTESDTSGDGNVDEIIRETYDENGNKTYRTENYDTDGDGTFDKEKTTSYNYDENGIETSEIQKYDDNGDGITDEVKISPVYDENGNLVTNNWEIDYNGDGTVDKTVTQTFDEDGNLTSEKRITSIISTAVIKGSTESDESDNVYEQEREEKYGTKYDDMSDEDKKAFDKYITLQSTKTISCAPSREEVEEGVTQTTYDKYIVTTIELYDGKTYEQLSDEEKELLEEWKDECKKGSLLCNINSKTPECPFEQTTETRIEEISE